MKKYTELVSTFRHRDNRLFIRRTVIKDNGSKRITFFVYSDWGGFHYQFGTEKPIRSEVIRLYDEFTSRHQERLTNQIAMDTEGLGQHDHLS